MSPLDLWKISKEIEIILKIFPIVAESRTRASYRIRAFLIDKTSVTFDSITINREILIKE